MKKIFIIASILISGAAAAQKNSILLQGNLTYTSTKVENSLNETRTSEYSSEPMWGYQFSDHWTAGLAWSVGRERVETTTVSVGPDYQRQETKNTIYTIGAFVRYTLPLNDLFSVYADLQGGYLGSDYRTTNDDALGRATGKVKGDGFTASITPEFLINITRGYKLNFAFGTLGYRTVNFDQNGGSIDDFGLSFGHTVTIGISRNFQL